MALARDIQIRRQEGEIAAFPVATGVTIYKGALVCINSSGYAQPATDAASVYFVGVASEYVANTGANGAKWITVYRKGVFEMPATSITQAMVGSLMYVANDGCFDDAASNYVVCGRLVKYISATRGQIDIEMAVVIGSTISASSVSIADAGAFTAQTQVEAALQELYQHMKTAQAFLPVPLNTLREASTFNVGAITANGGVLASDTTPVLSAINGATDGCQVVTWAAANVDQVVFQVPLPPDLDDTADLVIHFRIKSAGTTNAVGFSVDCFVNEGDTKVTLTSGTNQTATWAEKIATLTEADIPAGAQTLTVGLTPVTHATDALYLSAIWIEYKRAMLTS